jgi:hypothetical protein
MSWTSLVNRLAITPTKKTSSEQTAAPRGVQGKKRITKDHAVCKVACATLAIIATGPPTPACRLAAVLADLKSDGLSILIAESNQIHAVPRLPEWRRLNEGWNRRLLQPGP